MPKREEKKAFRFMRNLGAVEQTDTTWLWGWLNAIGGTYCIAPPPRQSAEWVQAMPEFTPNEVPGVSEELLEKISGEGGSIEEKLQCVIESFLASAGHLEGLQTLFRRIAVDTRAEAA